MRYALAFIAVLVAASTYGQVKEVISGYSHFQVTLNEDTIDFVVADTSLLEAKPVLLFCQGSQPVPLFIDFGDQRVAPVTLNNFDLDRMRTNYHVVVISMPKTPVKASLEHLNRSYNYVTDPASEYSYDPAYVAADHLDNYVNRANRVIEFLLQQKWVDASELVVAGHSQGSRVAVGIASSNKHVTKLGLFGYNPLRRVDQAIWAYRKQAQHGEITWQQADSLQQEEYEFYKQVLNDDSVAANPALRSWRSFSTSTVSELSHLKIPVYIAFGSEDNVAEYCDLLPLYFAETNKTDYVLKRYPNLEHNFFPLDEHFRPDYANGMWKEVMNVFVDWSLR